MIRGQDAIPLLETEDLQRCDFNQQIWRLKHL